MQHKKPIPVNSVEEEYVYVSEQRCKCGGMLEVTSQEFSGFPFPRDTLITKCEECSKTKKFLFDVSSFFEKQAKDILFKKISP